MNFYNVTACEGDAGLWYPTMADAHKRAKTLPERVEVQIDLWDVLTDKQGVLALLQGSTTKTLIKSWRLSTRGGLIECSPSQQ